MKKFVILNDNDNWIIRKTLREHDIEPQPAAEFHAREAGCWLLQGNEFDGMECRVVVMLNGFYGNHVANNICRCTSYLICVADKIPLPKLPNPAAVQWINPYAATTLQHGIVKEAIEKN